MCGSGSGSVAEWRYDEAQAENTMNEANDVNQSRNKFVSQFMLLFAEHICCLCRAWSVSRTTHAQNHLRHHILSSERVCVFLFRLSFPVFPLSTETCIHAPHRHSMLPVAPLKLHFIFIVLPATVLCARASAVCASFGWRWKISIHAWRFSMTKSWWILSWQRANTPMHSGSGDATKKNERKTRNRGLVHKNSILWRLCNDISVVVVVVNGNNRELNPRKWYLFERQT